MPQHPQVAPGQLTRHYAPKAALTLYEGEPALVIEKIGADARTAVAQGSRVGILAPEDDLKALAPVLASVGVKRPNRGASLRLPGGYRAGGTGILCRPEGPGRHWRLGDSRQLGRERRAGAGHPRPARARGRRAYSNGLESLERSFKPENPTSYNVLACDGWCYHAHQLGHRKRRWRRAISIWGMAP